MKTDVQTTPEEAVGTRSPSRASIIFLVITAFLATMGFGIISPVMPFIVQRYVGTNNLALAVGWLTSVYAVCQLIAAPALGKLSDRYGRRPLLLICLLGSAAGYALLGLGGALWMLLLGRIIDGLTGGNFSILFAYVADITEPKARGRFFGLFGGAAGLGLIIGPVIGGYAARLGYSAPLFLAAAITLLNILWGLFNLPESLRAQDRIGSIRLPELNPFTQLRDVFAVSHLRWLLLVLFLYALPFSILTSTATVLLKDSLSWNADTIGLMFLIVGTVDIITQGGLVALLMPRLGEFAMTVAGLMCEVAGYILTGAVALFHMPLLVIAGFVLFALGGGLAEPAMRGLLADVAGSKKQGVVQGGAQSLQSLGMIFGPIIGGELYVQMGPFTPYLVAASLALLGIITVFLALPSIITYRGRDGREAQH